MIFEEEICSSTCSEFFEDQEHTFTEVHYEGRLESKAKDTLFFQQQVYLYFFQDPMENLLQLAVKVIIIVFSDEGDHGQLAFWMPSYKYLFKRINQGGICLIGYIGRHTTHDCTYSITM